MAKYFQNPRESEGVLNFVRDNFCVDGGDKFYCVNCGQEVYIADYETVEGFQSTGAYQNTTEVMEPDEEQEMEKRVNDTVASINAYLEADKDNSPDLDIMIKLFSVFQNTMGLKVTVDDEKLIIALTLEMNRESIKDKVDILPEILIRQSEAEILRKGDSIDIIIPDSVPIEWDETLGDNNDYSEYYTFSVFNKEKNTNKNKTARLNKITKKNNIIKFTSVYFLN